MEIAFNSHDLARAVEILRNGGVIAHACEGVWGLACDPWLADAVDRIHQIKERPAEKGLILIGHDSSAFGEDLATLDEDTRCVIARSWPGHVTWIVPNTCYPDWITGGRATVALRVPAHDQARHLCKEFGGPLVSTSANKSGVAAARTEAEVRSAFEIKVDMVIPGSTAGAQGPSAIRVAATGERIR